MLDTEVTRYSHERLSELLRAQGRTVNWFAERLGRRVRNEPFDQSYASKLLNGDKPISPAIARAAADILGVPVHWLEAPVAAPERTTTEVAA